MRAETSGPSAEGMGRVLAIDYGRRRLGLAVSDERRMMARPLETVERVNRRADVARLRRIVREQAVAQLVVGLPLRLDGTAGEMAAEAREFAGRMAKALRLPVALVDERLTSWEASEGPDAGATKRDFGGSRRPSTSLRVNGRGEARHGAYSKAHGTADGVDSQAAALILEEYLRGEAARR
jgi:putative holliday junction resolvase